MATSTEDEPLFEDQQERAKMETEDQASEKLFLNLIGWGLILLVVLFAFKKLPEWREQQRDQRQFEESLRRY